MNQILPYLYKQTPTLSELENIQKGSVIRIPHTVDINLLGISKENIVSYSNRVHKLLCKNVLWFYDGRIKAIYHRADGNEKRKALNVIANVTTNRQNQPQKRASGLNGKSQRSQNSATRSTKSTKIPKKKVQTKPKPESLNDLITSSQLYQSFINTNPRSNKPKSTGKTIVNDENVTHSPNLYPEQEKKGEEICQKFIDYIDPTKSNYNSVRFFWLIPNINSLESQIKSRLNSHFPYNCDKMVLKSGRLEGKNNDSIFSHWKKTISSNENTLFIIVQDECHLSPKQNSVVSKITQNLLKMKNVYLLAISATAHNQLAVFKKKKEKFENILANQIIEWDDSDNYFGRAKYLELRDTMITVGTKVEEKLDMNGLKILVPFDYIQILLQSNENDIRAGKIIGKELVKGTIQSLNLLLEKRGLGVLKLTSVKDADLFCKVFGEILEQICPNELVLCVSVNNGKSSSIDCCNQELKFDNWNALLKHKICPQKDPATLLVVVNKGNIGDTFPSPFTFYDIRAREKINIWSEFEQNVGRAFGYGDRPLLLLSEHAFDVLKKGSADKLDSALEKDSVIQDFLPYKVIDNPNLVNTIKASEEYYYWDHDNWRETADRDSCFFSSNGNCISFERMVKLKKKNILFKSKKQYYILTIDNNFVDNTIFESFQDVLNDHNFGDMVCVVLDEISKDHAGIGAEFRKTFAKRLFLLARPQMGKTGAVIYFNILMNAIYSELKEYTPQLGEFPNFNRMKSESAKFGKAPSIYCRGKYGIIEVHPNNLSLNQYTPKHQDKDEYPILIQRVEQYLKKNDNETNNYPQTYLEGNDDNTPHQIDEFIEIKINGNLDIYLCKNSYLKENGERDIQKLDIKFPLFTISRGRYDIDNEEFNEQFLLDNKLGGKRCLQVVVILLNEYSKYRKKFPECIYACVKSNDDSVGSMRNAVIELAYHYKFDFAWTLDDNIKDITFMKLPTDREEQKLLLSDFLSYFEDDSFKDRDKYALIGPGKKTKATNIRNAFSVNSPKAMFLLNIKMLKEEDCLYRPNCRVAEDLEFAKRLCMNGLVICRFERFRLSKIQINIGGASSDTLQRCTAKTFRKKVEKFSKLDDGEILSAILEILLPKTSLNCNYVPNVALINKSNDSIKINGTNRNIVTSSDFQVSSAVVISPDHDDISLLKEFGNIDLSDETVEDFEPLLQFLEKSFENDSNNKKYLNIIKEHFNSIKNSETEERLSYHIPMLMVCRFRFLIYFQN